MEGRVMNGNRVRLAVAGLATGVLLLSACAGGMGSGSKAEFEQAYTDASSTLKDSKKLKHAWTTAENALKQSRKAADDGDYAKAVELAKQSREHSELAIQQSKTEDQAPIALW
jgi:hypothetical protein